MMATRGGCSEDMALPLSVDTGNQGDELSDVTAHESMKDN
jgi:hypothetical protein